MECGSNEISRNTSVKWLHGWEGGGVGECIDVRSGVDLPGEADSCAVERREGKSEGLSGAVGGGIRVFTARDGVAMGVVP